MLSMEKHLEQMSKTLLIVDDDTAFLRVLSRAMSRLNYVVWPADTMEQAKLAIEKIEPDYAVVDLHLNNECGLDVIEYIKNNSPGTTTIMLSGYANVATAVSATKLGAVDCLPKPINAEEIDRSLRTKGGRENIPVEIIIEPSEARLKHILAHWEKNDRNTTKTAKAMNMHRRSIQRILNRVGVGRKSDESLEKPSSFKKLRRLYRVWTRNIPLPSMK